MKIVVISFGPVAEEKNGHFNLIKESTKAIRKYHDADSIEFVSNQDLGLIKKLKDHNRLFVPIIGGLQGGSWIAKLYIIFLNSLSMHKIMKNYDIVIIETSFFLPYALIGKYLHKKVIFAMHGINLEMAWQNKKRPIKYLEQLFQSYFLDKLSSLISNIVLVTSNHDKAIAINTLHINKTKIKIRPVVVNLPNKNVSEGLSKQDLKKKLRISEESFIGMIIGDYSAEQNRKALDFLFSTEPMFPDNFILLVIGKTYGRYASTRKIRVLGYIENVNDYYELADGLILPLTTGMGIKTKIIESMAHGVRIFTTPIGMLGIDSGDCDGIYVYDLKHFWEHFNEDLKRLDYSKKCECLIRLQHKMYSSESIENAIKEILLPLEKHDSKIEIS